MRKLLLNRSVVGSLVALLSPAAIAANQLEEVQTLVSAVAILAFTLIAIAIAAFVYIKPVPSRIGSEAPLLSLLNGDEVIPAVEADASAMDCITRMTEQGLDSLLVMNDKKIIGIFTDRDALRNLLIPGRDPRNTRICEVMTLDPCCASPTMTVGEAMELITERHFKHLPVVENDDVRAILTRRDLKRWLAKDRVAWPRERIRSAA